MAISLPSTMLHVSIYLFVCLLIQTADCSRNDQLKMKVKNQAGAPVQLYWVNTFQPNATLVPQTRKPIRNNSLAQVNTFSGHQFAVQWLNRLPDTDVKFSMGDLDETLVVKVNETNGQLFVEKLDPHQEILDLIDSKTAACALNITEAVNLSDCVKTALVDEMIRIKDRQSKIEEFRDRMSARLRNYTCADPDMNTSTPVESFSYRFLDKSYKADVYLDTPNAKIWSVENFITESECQTLMDTARPNLMKATVSDESDGSSTFSEHRKAQQAGYEFAADIRDDQLWPLYDRVIKMVNHHSQMSLQPDGQEGFTVIQYNPGDEYTSHCDGTCDGSFVLPGARVATSVLYCKVPEKGGATSFTNANVFVQPKPLMATFFTYKGFDGQFDTGLTQHSGCPVIEGEKWIATTWLRDGVSKTNPWQRFDPSGVVILGSEEAVEPSEESGDFTENSQVHEEF